MMDGSPGESRITNDFGPTQVLTSTHYAPALSQPLSGRLSMAADGESLTSISPTKALAHCTEN